jgi:hypothetical protein
VYIQLCAAAPSSLLLKQSAAMQRGCQMASSGLGWRQRAWTAADSYCGRRRWLAHAAEQHYIVVRSSLLIVQHVSEQLDFTLVCRATTTS